VDKPETFDEFQPISLCNCVYKIISKGLTMGLKKVLFANISPESLAS